MSTLGVFESKAINIEVKIQ